MESVTIGNATLYNGECLEILQSLPPFSVDAVITDPPYMIGAVSTGNADAKSGGWADMENASFWFTEVLNRCKRVLKPDGYLCMFGNWRSLPTLMHAFSRAKWPIDSCMIWDKEWIGPAGPRQLRPTYEIIIFAGMPDAKIDNRSVPDIYRCKWMAGQMKTTPHAAEKPVQLMQHLIRTVTKPGAIVVDPFMGSGTTGEAAHLEKRHFIGIERESEYFHEIAIPRIRSAHAQFELLL